MENEIKDVKERCNVQTQKCEEAATHIEEVSLSLTSTLSLSLCSDGSRLSCCDVDHSAPQIPPLCHSGCFTNVCPRPFVYVSLPGSCWSPSASLPCIDPLDDGLFQAVVSDDVTKMFHLPFTHLFH